MNPVRKLRNALWGSVAAAIPARHLPSSLRSKLSDRDLVRGEEGVARDWYLRQYPDVAKAGVDPVSHYLSYGWREGRDPRPDFSTAGYLRAIGPAAVAGQNPLLHYLRRKMVGDFSDTQSTTWFELSQRGQLHPRLGCAPPLVTDRSYGTPGRRKILFTGHEASRTGAPLILLGLMEAFDRDTDAELFLVLERGGPLLERFSRIAHVVVNGGGALHAPDGSPMKKLIAGIASPAPEIAICNCAESWRLVQALRAAGVPRIVALVHERLGLFSDEACQVLQRDADRVVFPAEAVKRAAVHAVPAFRAADVLPQGLLRAEFGRGDRATARRRVREELGLPESTRIVLSCGTRDLRKGLDLFVQLAARVTSQCAVPVHFVWLGGDELATEVSTFVQHDLALLGLGSHVSLVANTADPEPYFLAADVFASTSRDDPFPCVVHEAMACALPIVFFEGAGGAVEALAGECGVALPYLDVEGMARAVDSMVERPADFAEMGARAERRVRSVYRFTDYAQRVLDICDGLRAVPSPSLRVPARRGRRRPPLSVIVPARGGLESIEPVLAALLPQAKRTGSEVLVVGPVGGPAPGGVRIVPLGGRNLLRMRMVGIREAQGEIVAIGEDHGVPRPDWCEAILRAHAERPDVPAIVGCLVNVSTETLSGRANFLGFAAPYAPPMAVLPPLRPPPVSALSLKREVLAEIDDQVGRFESRLVPRLFAEGRMAADDRIVVDHRQDHGILWSIANGFHGARSAYGYLRAQCGGRERLRQARWAMVKWPRRILGEASGASGSRAEVALAVLIGTAMGLGGAVGMLAGPGRSPDRVT